MAQGLEILGQDCFRSQLTIVPRLSTNGQTVDCVYDNGAVESAIGQVVVNLTIGLIIIILIVIVRLSLVPGPFYSLSMLPGKSLKSGRVAQNRS